MARHVESQMIVSDKSNEHNLFITNRYAVVTCFQLMDYLRYLLFYRILKNKKTICFVF